MKLLFRPRMLNPLGVEPGESRRNPKIKARKACLYFWSWQCDSNTRPADYESAALPTELCQLICNAVILTQLGLAVNTKIPEGPAADITKRIIHQNLHHGDGNVELCRFGENLLSQIQQSPETRFFPGFRGFSGFPVCLQQFYIIYNGIC